MHHGTGKGQRRKRKAKNTHSPVLRPIHLVILPGLLPGLLPLLPLLPGLLPPPLVVL